MKKVLALFLILGFCVVSAAQAGLPPKEPPTPIPSSAFPSLIGTWTGTLSFVDADGIQNVEVTVKITHYTQRRFRGWVYQGGSTTGVLLTGVCGPGNQVLFKRQAAGAVPALIGVGEIDWTGTKASIDANCFSLGDEAEAGRLLLTKTTY